MNTVEFQLRGISDPRLAAHASSPLPAWLWSTDGTHVLWANPVGAQVFGATDGMSLSKKNFGPADMHRRQVAQLARRLPPSGAIRLERLRGFGAALGMLITCFCARLEFAEGNLGILIVTTEPVGRPMPLAERLRHLTEGIDAPVAAFAREGMLVAARGARDPCSAVFTTCRTQALRRRASRRLPRAAPKHPLIAGTWCCTASAPVPIRA
jgi:hypothetical protein